MNKRTPFISLLTSLALLAAMFTSSVSSTARAQRKPGQQKAKVAHPFLSRYAVDLTSLARLGRLETRTGHRVEISRMIKLLANDGQRNPVLITESTANVQEIADSLARKIASGAVPETLQRKQVFKLNLDALSAGAKDSAEFVTRLQAVMSETAAAKGQIILFIDQLHQVVGSYANIQATAAIREALEHSQFRVIGAATAESYATYIAGDNSLTKLFQTIRVSDEAAQASDSSNEMDAVEKQEFVGDKVSPDLREMMQGASSPDDKVTAILQVDDVRNAELNEVLKRNGIIVSERMAQVGAVKVQLPVKAIAELAANQLTKYISPDTQLVSFGYGHVVITTGTDLVRSQSSGFLGLGGSTLNGTGIGIAVLDSGLDNGHAAFGGGRIRLNKDFTGENNPTNDPFGHGSHVAGAATGVSTRNGDRYQGMAPGASIINLRVLNRQGIGSSSALLSALNWILTPADPTRAVSSSNPLNKNKYNIRIVNMSLGAPAISSYRNDPLCRAARALVDAGIVVVAAAGNNGKDANGNKIYGQIHSPGNEPSVITVGAANTFGTDGRNDDGVATYSSRGPTRSHYTDASGVKHYDNIVKPEVVAPGNQLIFAESDSGGSLWSSGSENLLVTLHPELDSGLTDDNNRRLMYLSGTSMATPVVAGAAALLLQTKPELTPNMVKALLMYTAQPLSGFNMLEQGAGALNVEGAIRVATLVRNDLSNSTPTGAPFLTTSTLPTPQTTISGQTFTWSQGLITNHSYLTGTNLIMKYQAIYGQGVVIGDGDVAGDGIMVNDGIMVSDGVVMGDGIMVSDGVVMGDGTMFLAVSQLMGDGIMVNDGVVIGDGVVMGDGIMVNDGVVMGDAAVQAMSARALIGGDASPRMQ